MHSITLFPEFSMLPKRSALGKQMSLDTDGRSMGWMRQKALWKLRKLSIMGFQE